MNDVISKKDGGYTTSSSKYLRNLRDFLEGRYLIPKGQAIRL